MTEARKLLLIRGLAAAGAALLITACSDKTQDAAMPDAPAEETVAAVEEAAPADAAMPVAAPMSDSAALAAILVAQPDEVQARYAFRHPQETLEFFGIEPGMTVIEALPGGGLYSKILIPYLGEGGTLIGADYSPKMFPLFGFYNDEQLKAKESWVEDWTAEARTWVPSGGASIDGFQWGALPAEFAGQADAVLFIRALHNLSRFEEQGGFLTEAIAEAYTALRPGGVVGVVQHLAPEDASDAWASGDNGYLKKSRVVGLFEAAGFELAADSDINVNPKDQPVEGDFVWRLPPTMAGSRDNPEAAAAVREIGESTRMTLLFRKPA